MSMYYVPIAQCPFCEEAKGEGHILVDVAALSKERMSANARSAPNGDKPEDRIFLFNTAREKTGPCEHLLGLWCDVAWGTPRDDCDMLTLDWEYDCDFRNPRLGELNNDELAAEFFWDEVHGMGKSPIRPETSCHPSGVYTRWHDLSDPQCTDRHFLVEGRALFVEDINALMAELHERGVEYQAWLRDGKKPTREGEDEKYEFNDEYDLADVSSQ